MAVGKTILLVTAAIDTAVGAQHTLAIGSVAMHLRQAEMELCKGDMPC